MSEPYLDTAVTIVRTELHGYLIATRCLLYDGMEPCWETSVTGGALDGVVRRYRTPVKAERAHLWCLAEILSARWGQRLERAPSHTED